MSKDFDLSRAFQAVLVGDEKTLWVGQPSRLPFVASGVPFLVFGCLWGAFDYFGFIRHMGGKNGFPLGFAIPFFALHLIPFWGSIVNMIRLCLVVGNTYYAVTSKRILIRGGVWGTSFQSIDFDQIGNVEVKAKPSAATSVKGSIRFYTKQPITNRGRGTLTSFVGISNPFEVFKLVKQIHDPQLPRVA